ncbi:NtaA/DmoA family FMN-dependent monooxygenase [Kribbella sp. NPDC004536]|uniref:NtaA/DmoA family FMN-dependent monooxygenase n=1 Tax=Kribbella sp. NPDC004536 TaxID=3364106 RepID=UPI0036888461
MPANRFHLGWFCTFIADAWTEAWGSGGEPWDGGFYIELAKSLERACFDYVLIEDKPFVSNAYGGSMEAALKHASVPKHDSLPLAVLMAHATTRLGIVSTMSTTFYPPFMTARFAATIDHISHGRYGWNVVTSNDELAAQNFGIDKLPEHDLRYDMADEYVDLVQKLWDSWEPGAIVKDRERGIYADHTKVHAINFEGKFYKSRGPLNTAPPPQGRPVICQPSRSGRGMTFAAKYADTIIAIGDTVANMKAYRDEIHRLLAAHGREPGQCKVLFLVNPVVDETAEAAREKVDRLVKSDVHVEYILGEISKITNVDFSRFDLDQPLPAVTTAGEKFALEWFGQNDSGKNLRDLVGLGIEQTVELIGTPDEVADRMGAIMAEVGGDGFLINPPMQRLHRRYITEITDGLVPALQRRGLVRAGYSHQLFRHNLLEF